MRQSTSPRKTDQLSRNISSRISMDMSRKSMTATPKVNKDSKTKDIIMVSKDSKAKDNKGSKGSKDSKDKDNKIKVSTMVNKANKGSKTKVKDSKVSKANKDKASKDKASKDKRTDKDPAVFSEALPKDLARSCLPKLEDSRSIPPTA